MTTVHDAIQLAGQVRDLAGRLQTALQSPAGDRAVVADVAGSLARTVDALKRAIARALASGPSTGRP